MTVWKKPRTLPTDGNTDWRSRIAKLWTKAAKQLKRDNTLPYQSDGWKRVRIGVLFSKFQDSWNFLVLIEPGADELKFCGRALGRHLRDNQRPVYQRSLSESGRDEYSEKKPRNSIYLFLINVDTVGFLDDVVQDIFWSWEQFISETMSQIHRV